MSSKGTGSSAFAKFKQYAVKDLKTKSKSTKDRRSRLKKHAAGKSGSGQIILSNSPNCISTSHGFFRLCAAAQAANKNHRETTMRPLFSRIRRHLLVRGARYRMMDGPMKNCCKGWRERISI